MHTNKHTQADDVDLEELLQPKPSFKPKLNRTYIVVLDLSSCGLRTDDVKELCYVLSEVCLCTVYRVLQMCDTSEQ